VRIPDEFIEFLGYSSISDIIENLYIRSLIDAYPKVLQISNIDEYDEPNIKDEFQKIICSDSGKLSQWIANRTISLAVENQIIIKEVERKRTDLEFNIPCLKYIIEFKKLKSASKTQYIDNGISRFINDIYTNEYDKFAGMCSFIVGGNIDKIIQGIKDKIRKYHLVQYNNNKICNFDFSFSSTHQKINSTEILLHHIFFDIRKTK
jgi:hypothetical protein